MHCTHTHTHTHTHRYERQLRACGFVGVSILWARFGFVTWIAHKKDPTRDEEDDDEILDVEEEEECAVVSSPLPLPPSPGH